MHLELKTENKYFTDNFQSVNSYDKVLQICILNLL